jgi:hypothetical protein
MRRALSLRYRLAPDRRLLTAVSQVHHLLTGEPLLTVTVIALDSAWRVKYGEAVVGDLPEQPRFEDGWRLLSDWADRISSSHLLTFAPLASDDPAARTPEALDAFVAPRVVPALQQIDWAWGQGSRAAEFLPWAGRGLVYLFIQSFDELDLADRTASAALATLIAANRLTGAALLAERALLADGMGYRAEAETLAQDLAGDDPVRLYMEHRLAALGASARSGGDPLTEFLYLSVLGQDQDPGAWSAAMAAAKGLAAYRVAALKTALQMHRFEGDALLAPVAAIAAADELWLTAGMPAADRELSRMFASLTAGDTAGFRRGREALGVDYSSLVSRFERELGALDATYPGPFLDAETWKASLRSSFYSAIHTICVHQLDGQASLPDARSLVEALSYDTTVVSAELHRWYGHLVDQMGGRSNPGDLVDDLRDLTTLGGAAHHRTFEALTASQAYGGVQGVTAAERLAARLDTRQLNLRYMANVARLTLLDLPLTARYGGRALSLAGPGDHFLAQWVAAATHDTTRLRALLADQSVLLATRCTALESMLHDSLLDPAGARDAYHALMREAPDNWEVRSSFARWLEAERASVEAEAVAREWLARHGRRDGFDYVDAVTAIARAQESQGRLDDAWGTLQPVIPTWRGETMARGVSILRRMGRDHDAAELGQAVVDRYPDAAYTRAALAGALWAARRFDDAARVLAEPGHLQGPSDWRDELGPVFIEVLGHDARAVRSALRALTGAGIPALKIEELAVAADRRGQLDLAFQIESGLNQTPNSPGTLQFPVRAYGYLRRARGERAGLAWLKGTIGEYPPEMAVLALFRERQDGLLWDYVPAPGGWTASWVWELRAASALRNDSLPANRRRELEDYFGQPARRAWYWLLSVLHVRSARYFYYGRYLFGLANEDQVLGLSESLDARTEAAWVIAYQAQSQRRYEDAEAWYRVVLELAEPNEEEYVLSRDQLYQWMTEGFRDRLSPGRS